MGLLSNPKSRQKIVGAITKYNNILCAVCYVVGIIWFLALAYPPLNAKTYFSENALLPGIKWWFKFIAFDFILKIAKELPEFRYHGVYNSF